MGRKSISPSVLKDILRLRDNGLSFRAIGERCQLSHSAVRRYYQQAQKRNLSWDKVKYHSDAKLTGEIKQLQQPRKVKYHEPNFDEYSKLLYLHKIRGIDDAYAGKFFFKWLQDSLKLEQCSANLERPRKQKFSLDGTRISAIWFLIHSKRNGFGILPR